MAIKAKYIQAAQGSGELLSKILLKKHRQDKKWHN